MSTQVNDFLYNYEDQNIQGFQQYISGKYEFAQLASDMREDVPTRGNRFKHQELIVRFMKIYDKVLLMHDTGTGKTCTTLGLAQEFKHEWMNGAIEYANTYINGLPGNIRRVIIFTKSETLENEFRHQLVCKCTGYEEYEAKLSKTKQGMGSKKALTNNLNKYFTFKHYRSFANSMKDTKDDNIDIVLREMFENTLFILDEVQDLVTDSDREGSEVRSENKSAYELLWRISHVCQNIKIMCASATPMIDRHTEIVPVMNLILPIDMQMNDAMLDPNIISIENLEPYFRGRVSYVRALDTGAIPTYVGEPLNEMDNFTVFRSYMDYSTIHGRMSIDIAEHKDSYRSKSRQAGLFVFPDGSVGKTGMEKYFKYENGKYAWNYSLGTNELRIALDGEPGSRLADNVYQFSPKYSTSLNLLETLEGSHFQYFNFVEVGTNLYSILLDLMGYERYNPTSSSFNKMQMGGKLKFCSDDTAEIVTSLPKAKRYAIITSSTKNTDHILELMNSPINVNGEYIKTLLVSEVAKTGINVSNIRYGHLMDPAWNQSTAYQALSRFIRTTSHIDLIKYVAETTGVNISDVRLDIIIFQHCLDWSDGTNTIDKILYTKCIEKDKNIRKVFRILKQCAFDCQIHKKRNIRSTDIDYSPVCDYDTCNYVCSDEDPTVIDYTSYNAIYSGDEIIRIEREIGSVFRSVSFIKYTNLIDHLMNVFNHDITEMRMLADRAIRHIVEERKVIRDRYNFICYLREDKNDLFIQREYPVGGNDDSSLSLYSSRLIGVSSKSLNTIIKTQRSIITPTIIDDINNLTTLSDVFVYCNSLNNDLQVSILEHYLYKYGVENDRSDKTIMIVRTYIYNIFWFEEPIAELEEQRISADKRKLEEASITGKPLGKKKTLQTNYQKFGDIVYVHNLNPSTGVLYDETARSKTKERLRVMTSYEKVFRDPDPFELKIYSGEIGNQRDRRNERFNQFGIYGSYSYKTDTFRLVMNYRNIDVKDKRDNYRGTVCKTYPDKKNIINIAIDLNISIPIVDNSPINVKKQYLIKEEFDLSNRSNIEIERLYEMYKVGNKYKSETICDLILGSMVDRGMVSYVF